MSAGASRSARTGRYFKIERGNSINSQAWRWESPRSIAKATWSLRLASSLFSAVDLLRRLDRHLAIGDHPLELGVFRQLAQALHVRRLRQPKSPPPHVDRRLADLCFLATSATEFPSASRKIATIGS